MPAWLDFCNRREMSNSIRFFDAFSAIEFDSLRHNRPKKSCRKEHDPAVIEVDKDAVPGLMGMLNLWTGHLTFPYPRFWILTNRKNLRQLDRRQIGIAIS